MYFIAIFSLPVILALAIPTPPPSSSSFLCLRRTFLINNAAAAHRTHKTNSPSKIELPFRISILGSWFQGFSSESVRPKVLCTLHGIPAFCGHVANRGCTVRVYMLSCDQLKKGMLKGMSMRTDVLSECIPNTSFASILFVFLTFRMIFGPVQLLSF